jgi:Chaperone of endosialidase
MALIVKDRVQEISTTVGTGTLTLGGAVLGFQSFAAIGDGNTTYYAISDPVTGDWEVGIGTYTSSGTTLSRDTVLSSSTGASPVSFVAGTKNVFCTYPSERAIYLDSAGSYPVQNTFNTLNVTTATITAGTVSTTPTSGTDIANKTYVDNLVAAGTHFHEPVRVESPINLNATYNNGTAGVGATLTNAGTQVALVIDGVTVSVADRVLVYEQTNQTQNGVYVVTDVGSGATNWVLTRASDADTYVVDSPNGLSEGSTFFVQEGTTGAGETYTCNTSGVITFGTTNITFAQISSAQIYSAGTGLSLSGTQFSIANTTVTPASYGTASSVGTFTVNAQGQLTNAVDTPIAIGAAAVSGLAASATTDTTNANNITSGSLGTSRLSGSYTGITGVGALAAGSLASGFTAVSAPLGGTGQTSYTVGDILYADTSTSIAKLADVAVGNALISGGVGAAPSWGKIGLATHVSGTLPVANGGTGSTSTTFVNLTTNVSGTLPIANGGSGATTAQGGMNAFAGAVTSGQYLRGNGSNVVMSAIQAGDVPTLNQNTTGTAAGLSATLAVASGGTGQTTYTNGQLLIGNTTGNTLAKATLTGTADQVVVTNGAGSITLSTPQSIGTASSVQFGSLGVGTTASGTTGEIRATNNVTAYFSDERLKTKIGDIENALDKVLALSGFYYEPNEVAQALGYTIQKEVGVSAQEVQRILPEAVAPAPIDDKYLTVRYERIVPLLIEAIKEIKLELDALKRS